MGEFQRSRSKVWWSNYVEADTEDEEPHNRNLGWGGSSLVLSPPRGSSSSPSSSHKSQDSGFSDSEASSTPAGSRETFKASPLPSLEQNEHLEEEPQVHDDDCVCPQLNEDNFNDTKSENKSSNDLSNTPTKSPGKLKGQLFKQCVCIGQTSPTETSECNKKDDKSCESLNKNIDFSSQLPVKKLREKFLQDCMCLNQKYNKPNSNSETVPIDIPKKQNCQNSPQVSVTEFRSGETGKVTGNYSETPEHKQVSNKSADTQESVSPLKSLDDSTQKRLQISLSRSLPVPTLRTSQNNQNNISKESPSNKSQRGSPVPSPRYFKSESPNSSLCQNNLVCKVEKPSPLKRTKTPNNLQSPHKQADENGNVSVQSAHNPEQNNNLLSASPHNKSSGGDRTTCLESSNKKESPTNSVNSALTEQLGSPTHTSTPKTSTAVTPSKLLVTPNRPLRCIGLGKKNGRPTNLLNNFNSNLQSEGADSEGSSVQHWLGELATLYEPECMTTLQSKSLAVDLSHQVAIMAAATTDTVKMLQDNTKLISTEFAKLCQQLEYSKMEHVGPLVQSLVGLVTEFLHEHCIKSEKKREESKIEENTLMEVCDRLRITAAKQPPDKEQLTLDVAELGTKFTRIVDNMLTQHISVLIGVLEEPTSDLALRSALSSLTTLGLEGPHLSCLVAQCNGVRALLTVCLESRSSSIRTSALRALATVCCVVEAIRQLEQAGGVEIISEMLSEESRPEPEVSEAAAVLAQITAPWVEDNHSVSGLAEQLPSLVKSLTRLASNTASCETLLLSAAALANLTFMEPRTVWPLLEQETAGKLLQAVKKRGPKVSVFLQEQAATLIANMAAVPESRPHLAEQRAVVALLCFLQIRHSPLQRAPEIAAAERVQQKSAIALSRLCSDPVVAAQVVELQGVNRLVRLCKEERERNHSDGVLVACLAALRKIAANCGTKVIEDLDAMELVEPRLLDSFLIYSSRQESYV